MTDLDRVLSTVIALPPCPWRERAVEALRVLGATVGASLTVEHSLDVVTRDVGDAARQEIDAAWLAKTHATPKPERAYWDARARVLTAAADCVRVALVQIQRGVL